MPIMRLHAAMNNGYKFSPSLGSFSNPYSKFQISPSSMSIGGSNRNFFERIEGLSAGRYDREFSPKFQPEPRVQTSFQPNLGNDGKIHSIQGRTNVRVNDQTAFNLGGQVDRSGRANLDAALQYTNQLGSKFSATASGDHTGRHSFGLQAENEMSKVYARASKHNDNTRVDWGAQYRTANGLKLSADFSADNQQSASARGQLDYKLDERRTVAVGLSADNKRKLSVDGNLRTKLDDQDTVSVGAGLSSDQSGHVKMSVENKSGVKLSGQVGIGRDHTGELQPNAKVELKIPLQG
uniref:Uncharacterized protein n=1 Tax=Romanomermis culicivorax TaxID=13658 RepID=A0A915IXT2_ROMCU